jgi:hypothetical protein
MTARPRRPPDPCGPLRTAVLAVSASAVVGTALQLALVEHWRTPVQLLPWAALAAASLANVVLLTATGAQRLRAVRALAGCSVLVGGLGVLEHLAANRDVMELVDPQSSAAGVLWDALRGPFPVPAAAVVVLPAVLTLVATLGHPLAVAARSRAATEPIMAVR